MPPTGANLARTRTSRTCTTEQTPITGIPCSVEGCTARYASSGGIKHMERHTLGLLPGDVPQSWLTTHAKFVCRCRRIVAVSRQDSHQSRCSAGRPVTQPEPAARSLPKLEEVMALPRATLKHIPASARQAFGSVYSEALRDVIALNSTEAWTRLLMLPKCVLPSSKRAGRNLKRPNITAFCRTWSVGEWSQLWDQAKASAQRIRPIRSPTEVKSSLLEEARLSAATALAQDGLFGKAARILTSSGIAPNTQATWSKLISKHPSSPTPSVPSASQSPLQLPPNFDIQATLRSFPSDTACGSSGLRVQHLLEAAEATLPTSLCSSLRTVVNILLRGAAPPEVLLTLASANLTALNKGESDIRPIASGEILRRLVSKCACACVKAKALQHFQPNQFGVAHPGGIERIIHRLRSVLDDHWESEDFVVLKVDMTNAFNSVSRQLILDECARHFPELLPWTAACYAAHPILRHPLGTLTSATGVQQGDPLGPLLFALALHGSVQEISDSIPLQFHAWYLDDGVLCGTLHSISRAVEILRRATPTSGLEVNLHKCEAFSRSNLDALSNDIRKSSVPNLEILGSPIGAQTFCKNYISQKREKAGELLGMLPRLHNPQIALSILRRCAGFCRLVSIARATPVESAVAALAPFDDDLRKTLEECTAIECTDKAWRQAQLPIREGGLGLRSVAKHASSAFIASYTASTSEPSSYLTNAVQHFNKHVAPDDRKDPREPIGDEPMRQHALSEKVDAADKAILLENASTAEKARLDNISAPNAAAWLRVVPSPGLGLALEPNEMSAALKWWLGLPLNDTSHVCPFHPATPLDPHGHHALTCGKNGDVVNRHNRLRDVLFESCSRALLRPQLERGATLGEISPQSRPADVLIPGWSLGQPAAVDVTVAHPLNPVHLNGASATAVQLLAAAEERKRLINGDKCKELGWVCLPFAMTAYGGYGDEATRLISRLTCRLAVQTGARRTDCTSALFGRLSTTLVRANAQAILKRTATAIGRSDIERLTSED